MLCGLFCEAICCMSYLVPFCSCVFLVLLALRLPRLGRRELILVLFVCLIDLCLFAFVGFLFLLMSGKGCGLWLWHSLDFSITFFVVVPDQLSVEGNHANPSCHIQLSSQNHWKTVLLLVAWNISSNKNEYSSATEMFMLSKLPHSSRYERVSTLYFSNCSTKTYVVGTH